MFMKPVSRVVGGNGCSVVASDSSSEYLLLSIEGPESDVLSV